MACVTTDGGGREGSLDAPTRHPLNWRDAGVLRRGRARAGTAACIRHLPRLSALLQPVPVVPDPVRCHRCLTDHGARWGRQAGLLAGGGELLPVRHVLHDQVSVRAAAPLERGLSAPDAARQGSAGAAGASSGSPTACSVPPMRSGSIAGIPVVAEIVNAANRNGVARKLLDKTLGRRSARAVAEVLLAAPRAGGSSAALRRDLPPQAGRRYPRPGGVVHHLLWQSQ